MRTVAGSGGGCARSAGTREFLSFSFEGGWLVVGGGGGRRGCSGSGGRGVWARSQIALMVRAGERACGSCQAREEAVRGSNGRGRDSLSLPGEQVSAGGLAVAAAAAAVPAGGGGEKVVAWYS